jgi:hypothetical protein
LYNGAFICKSAVPHYADNGDGTVTDNQTGLMWEKKTGTVLTPNPSDAHDVNNFYSWSAASVSQRPDGTLFATFLAGLNGGDYYNSTDMLDESGGPGTCFANHCDWRIPTIVELQGILLSPHPCSTSPCIDPTFVPTRAANYWSSSSLAGNPFNAWYVYFGNGDVSSYGKDDPLSVGIYARAVRGSFTPAAAAACGTVAVSACSGKSVGDACSTTNVATTGTCAACGSQAVLACTH